MKKSGFTIVEVLIVVATLAIICGVGYVAYKNFTNPKDEQATSSSTTSDTSSTVKVETTDDLTIVDTQLDQLEIDDGDAEQLESAANSF
jgi:prepilin-type N-terminal cleavage/methylation domain-containing protein